MKIVTSYFEDRREALFERWGPQMLADVIGYGGHRASIQRVLLTELKGAARAAHGRPVLPVALSLGGIALIDLLAELAGGAGRGVRDGRLAGAAAVHVRCLAAMPYDEADPPRLPVPWLNIYDSRDFLSFVAEPLFRRRDGLASVVDLRVRSGRDFPASHSAYWELSAGLGCDRDGLRLAADRAVDGPRGASARVRGAKGAEPAGNEGATAAGCAMRLRRPRVPQRWKLCRCGEHDGKRPRRGSWPRGAISRARGGLWTSKVHLLFGSPATCVRPVALRTRLATGLPLSIDRRQGWR